MRTILMCVISFVLGILLVRFVNVPSWYSLYASGLGRYPQLRTLFIEKMSFEQLRQLFRSIAQEKGAVYALEALKVAPLSPTVNSHLLAHAIGDILLEQEGQNGIVYCTPHFRNACAHSIVGSLLLKHGESALKQVAQTCRNSKGIGREYEQCMHGIGHGLLSGIDYNVPRTIALCQSIGIAESNGKDIGECIGGAMMELSIGGGHNEDIYMRESKKYLRQDDPFYPCNSSMVPIELRPVCYEYFVFRIFAIVAGDPHRMEEQFFARAIGFCDHVPETDPEGKKGCYRGFGREFASMQTVSLQRKGNEINAKFQDIHMWCSYGKNLEGNQACINNAAQTLYWNGEYTSQDALDFCLIAQNEITKSSCLASLVESNKYNTPEKSARFCSRMPNEYRQQCKEAIQQ